MHKSLIINESIWRLSLDILRGSCIMVYMMRDKEILLETTTGVEKTRLTESGLGQQDTECISLNYKGKL